MSSPFVAEIRIFAGNFAPTGWALCNGQLLPISQNTALFSLLGTFYGGDGKSTFALPDMQGNAPMNQGDGPGLSQRFLGEMSGTSNVTLIQSEMPAHNHIAMGGDAGDGQTTPGPANVWAGSADRDPPATYTTTAPNVNMNPFALGITGSSFPHNNMQPYLTLTFIIALQGVFPPRG